jgi:hypothetical protein
MRKISKTGLRPIDHDPVETGFRDTAPLRIPGATITAWSDSFDIDLEVFFSQPASDATVAGAGSSSAGQANHSSAGGLPANCTPAEDLHAEDRADADAAGDRRGGAAVSLSDGTKIIFAAVFSSVP